MSTYRDFEAWEIASAIIIALCVQVGTGTAMYLTKAEDRCAPEAMPVCPAGEIARCSPSGWECKPSCAAPPPECPIDQKPTCEADVWECRPPEEIVEVKPVLDVEAFEAAKLGGKKAVLPEMWDRAPESVKKKIQEIARPKDTTVASTQIESNDIPDAGEKVVDRDWGLTDSGLEPTTEDADVPEDAGPQDGADSGTVEGADAGDLQLDPDGGNANTAGAGCVGEGCTKDGTNPDHIAASYLGRLIGFFKRGFSVSGIGLPPEEIAKLSVGVSVTLSGDGTVTGFSMSSSGNAAFDAAARGAMQAKVGQGVPPHPEDRPDLKRTSLSFTMVCPKSCN